MEKILPIIIEIKDLLYAILSFLFGLLSGSLLAIIYKIIKKGDTKKVILAELRNIETILVVIYFRIYMYFGEFDKANIEWVRDKFESNKRHYEYNDWPSFLIRLLKMSEPELTEFGKLQKDKKDIALDPKEISLSFLESQLESLYLFDNKFRDSIFEIRSQINILNEEIKNVRYYFHLTFDSTLTDSQTIIVIDNMEKEYKSIQRKSRSIVDRISGLLN